VPTLLAAGDPLSFYSTAAGIIPVIVLALAFEFGSSGFGFIPERVLGREPDATRRARRDVLIATYSLAMLAVLLVGEAVALLVIALGTPQPWWAAIVAVSLVVGGAGLVIPIAVAQLNVILEDRPSDRAIRNRSAVAVKLLAGLLATASLAGASYAVLAPSRVTVPDVVGLSPARADEALKRTELKLAPALGQRVAVGVPPGTVIAQSPAAGASVRQGSRVSAVVAVGPDRSVPNLVGLTLAEAQRTIRAQGFSLGTVVPRRARPNARVRAQSPAAGTVAGGGSPVSLAATP
jgi:hypothetical protein